MHCNKCTFILLFLIDTESEEDNSEESKDHDLIVMDEEIDELMHVKLT